MKRLAILIAACVVYLLAAWTAAPGFYDGFGPPQAYRWTCPPPQAGFNQQPASGHVDVKVGADGVSEPSDAFTLDGQVVIGFLPGAFNAAGKSSISVDVAPTSTCPHPSGITFVTNTYQITSNASLVKDSNLTLVYSNLKPDPSSIYFATSLDGPWTSIGEAPQAQPFTVWTKTRNFGYYAAGYPEPSSKPSSVTLGGGQTLPIIVAALIVIVLLAGLPLAVVRRRSG